MDQITPTYLILCIDVCLWLCDRVVYQPKATTLEFVLARVVTFDANMLCDPVT